MTVEEIAEAIDWQTAGDEAVALLRQLIRIDTTNADDVAPNETEAANLLAGFLRGKGLEPQVLESEPGKGSVIARMRGDGSGGAPILSSGHLDVVPADPAGWDHPPFGAEIHDGCIWGRGAIDCKNMVAMQSVIAGLLVDLGAPLRRDLIVAGVADEEAGCAKGSMWLAEEHPDLIRAEFVLNEAGGYSTVIGGTTFWPIQVAEKGVAWLTIRAKGTPGHGSEPNRDNPIAAIGAAADRLGNARLPFHLTPLVKSFLDTIADNVGLPESLAMRALRSGATAGFALEHVIPSGVANPIDAALHNTANPTMLWAGSKVNQIPAEAIMRVDARTLPGFTAEDVVAEIRRVIGDGFEITVDMQMPPVVGNADNPVMDRIRETLGRHDPDGIVLPYLMPAFTDAKAYSKLGATVIGFTPIQLPPDISFTAMFHGNNERIPIDGFRFGLRALFEVVAGMVL